MNSEKTLIFQVIKQKCVKVFIIIIIAISELGVHIGTTSSKLNLYKLIIEVKDYLLIHIYCIKGQKKLWQNYLKKIIIKII